jgi:ABC-2 type transport system permease protein
VSHVLLLVRAWRLDLEQLLRARLFLFVAVVLPLIFASIAFTMFRGSDHPAEPVAIALTAGLMGMWSATLLGAGNTITRLRRWALLEPLVASPASTFSFTVPFAVASATFGVYALAATLLWSAVAFDMPLHVAQPWLLLASVPITVLSMGLLGLVFASAFILYPRANGLANLFEYPVWMLSGVLVPIAELPAGARVVSYALAPTWGVEAVLGAATGAPGAGAAAAMCLVLSVAYLGVAALLLRRFEWLARSSGTLPLH